MSDEFIPIDFHSVTKQGIDQIGWSEYGPFTPSIQGLYNDDGSMYGVGVLFNQGYVFNLTDEDETDIFTSKIDGMDQSFEITSEDPIQFAVKIVLDSDNLNITSKSFESGFVGFVEESGWDYPHIFFYEDPKGSEARPEAYTGYIPVCVIDKGDLREFTCRENIFFSERQFAQWGTQDGCVDGVGGEAQILIKKLADVDVYNNEDWPIMVRSIVGGDNVCVTQGDTHIEISAAGDLVQSGMNTGCGSLSDGIAEVFVEASKDPMYFRRLKEGDNVDISTADDCITIESSDCVNIGNCSPSFEIHNEASTKPFQFRKLTNGNNITLSYTAGDASSDHNCIKIEGAAGTYEGSNRGDGEAVFVPNTAAEYKTLEAYEGSHCKGGIILSSDDDEITISGSAPWTGENGPAFSAEEVYVDPTGPQNCTKAKFRTIGPRSASTVDPPPQIKVGILEGDNEVIRISGNNCDGSLSIPKDITLTCNSNSSNCGTLSNTYAIRLEWEDGLITGLYDTQEGGYVTSSTQTLSNA